MANRIRQIRKEICLTKQEKQIIKSKMEELVPLGFQGGRVESRPQRRVEWADDGVLLRTDFRA